MIFPEACGCFAASIASRYAYLELSGSVISTFGHSLPRKINSKLVIIYRPSEIWSWLANRQLSTNRQVFPKCVHHLCPPVMHFSGTGYCVALLVV